MLRRILFHRAGPTAVIRHPEMTPAETTEVPGPDLFMTVIKVADWPTALAWYVDTLGLLAVLTDPEHEFVLLAAGTGRRAVQGGREAGGGGGPPGIRNPNSPSGPGARPGWRFREVGRRGRPERSGSCSRCRTWSGSGCG